MPFLLDSPFRGEKGSPKPRQSVDIECVFIAVGVLAVLAVVTLRNDAGGDAGSLGGYAESLAAINDWTFLLGPGFIVGIGNGLILGYLM